jgi:tripartite-type tricarboxylate transporter receptor subunit TctC
VAGINLQAIGYKGQPQIITDLLGGQLDVAFVATGLITQHVQSGKLKALGVIGRERARQMPGIPTLIEAGYPEAGVTAWYAFFTRAGAPRDALEKINADIGRVLALPDVKEKIEKLGGEAAQPMSLAEMSRMVNADTERWSAVIKAGNIKAE